VRRDTGRPSMSTSFDPKNARDVKPLPRLKLQGFNNLTKSLSFNI
jgi:hypothetical protein